MLLEYDAKLKTSITHFYLEKYVWSMKEYYQYSEIKNALLPSPSGPLSAIE